MEDGYIKISRKILNWEWYRNINTKILFLHLLLKANWKDGRFEGEVIPRGSLVSSLPRLAEETSLTMNELRTAVKHLKHSGEITCRTKRKYTVFTIKNYAVYQDIHMQSTDEAQADNRQFTDEAHAIDRRLTTIEEGKKERKEEGNTKTPLTPLAPEETATPLAPEETAGGKPEETAGGSRAKAFSPADYISEQGMSEFLEHKLLEWLSYKKERRMTYKETGLKSLVTQIKNKAQEYGELAVCNLITECMANGWQGIIWEKLEKPRAGRDGNVFYNIGKEEGLF